MSHKYRIFSSKHVRHLFNVEALRGSAYQRLAIKQRRRLFLKKRSYSCEICKLCHYSCEICELCHCLFPNNCKQQPLRYILVLHIPATIVISIAAMYIYIYIFVPYPSYLGYCQIMDRILIKNAFGSEALIRGWRVLQFKIVQIHISLLTY